MGFFMVLSSRASGWPEELPREALGALGRPGAGGRGQRQRHGPVVPSSRAHLEQRPRGLGLEQAKTKLNQVKTS